MANQKQVKRNAETVLVATCQIINENNKPVSEVAMLWGVHLSTLYRALCGSSPKSHIHN